MSIENVENTHSLVVDAIRAGRREAERGARRAEDAGLSLGQVDDHLKALATVADAVEGREFDTAHEIASAILGAGHELEEEL